jgi:hypothetical protein
VYLRVSHARRILIAYYHLLSTEDRRVRINSRYNNIIVTITTYNTYTTYCCHNNTHYELGQNRSRLDRRSMGPFQNQRQTYLSAPPQRSTRNPTIPVCHGHSTYGDYIILYTNIIHSWRWWLEVEEYIICSSRHVSIK